MLHDLSQRSRETSWDVLRENPLRIHRGTWGVAGDRLLLLHFEKRSFESWGKVEKKRPILSNIRARKLHFSKRGEKRVDQEQ